MMHRFCLQPPSNPSPCPVKCCRFDQHAVPGNYADAVQLHLASKMG